LWGKNHVLQVPSLIVIGDIEDFPVLARDGVSIQGLHSHFLAEGVVVAGLFEFLLFGGEFLNNLFCRDPLWGIGDKRSLLRKAEDAKNDQGENIAD